MPTKPETETNDLAALVKDINGGEFHQGATKAMKTLVASLKDVERNLGGTPKGKLIIAFDLKLEKGIIDIRASVKVTEPSSIAGRTMRYGTEDGVLLKEDPRQHILGLTDGR